MLPGELVWNHTKVACMPHQINTNSFILSHVLMPFQFICISLNFNKIEEMIINKGKN